MSEPGVCFLTGAAGGIGGHLADQFVAHGYRLFATDVNAEVLASHAAAAAWPADRVVTAPLDVRDAREWEAAIDRAIARFGRIDVLVNVAGCLRPGLVHEVPSELVDLHLDVNAKGTIFGTQAAARRMVAQGSGHIVNIASMAALAPVPGIALYTASKFAVRGFSLAVARELRPHGVRVTVICPDAVKTPMLDLQVDYPEAALTFTALRYLSVEDVSRAMFKRVLTRRPLEVVLPRRRGWLAKFSSLAPAWTEPLLPWLTRRGRARQKTFQRK